MIQEKIQRGSYNFTVNEFGVHQLATKTIGDELRTVVPCSLHDVTVQWYHHILGHCGQERLAKSIRYHLHFPRLDQKAILFVETCDKCQCYKSNGPRYSHLPPQDNYSTSFEEVALDHIGLWTLDVADIGKS